MAGTQPGPHTSGARGPLAAAGRKAGRPCQYYPEEAPLAPTWMATTSPVGRCVMRTAESVVFTCCPPAPPELQGGGRQAGTAGCAWCGKQVCRAAGATPGRPSAPQHRCRTSAGTAPASPVRVDADVLIPDGHIQVARLRQYRHAGGTGVNAAACGATRAGDAGAGLQNVKSGWQASGLARRQRPTKRLAGLLTDLLSSASPTSPDSVTGTRCTRWMPDSHLSCPYTPPAPAMAAEASLQPPRSLSASSIT